MRTAPAISRRLIDSRQPSSTEVLMRRIGLAIGLALSMLLAPLAAGAQAKKTPRIGFLAPPSAEYAKSRVAAFEQALHQLGYVDGKSIIIEYRYADGRFERLPNLATELVRLGVDILVVMGERAVHAGKNSTSLSYIIIVHVHDAAC